VHLYPPADLATIPLVLGAVRLKKVALLGADGEVLDKSEYWHKARDGPGRVEEGADGNEKERKTQIERVARKAKGPSGDKSFDGPVRSESRAVPTESKEGRSGKAAACDRQQESNEPQER